jgi:hypothetical protein
MLPAAHCVFTDVVYCLLSCGLVAAVFLKFCDWAPVPVSIYNKSYFPRAHDHVSICNKSSILPP